MLESTTVRLKARQNRLVLRRLRRLNFKFLILYQPFDQEDLNCETILPYMRACHSSARWRQL
jgi:hypothetical protein